VASNHKQIRENKTREWHSNQKRKEKKTKKRKGRELESALAEKTKKKKEEEEGAGKDERREEEEGDDVERSWRRAGTETERELGRKKKEEEGRRRRGGEGEERKKKKKKTQKSKPAKIYILAETPRNSPKWPKHPETPRNFTRGGMGGCLVPVCIPVRDFPSFPVGTERNIQLCCKPLFNPSLNKKFLCYLRLHQNVWK
jgi:hypothetical protein